MMHTNFLVIVFLIALTTACKPLEAASISNCESNLLVAYSDKNTLSTTADSQVMRLLEPNFFGFNLEWVDFQQDMWDARSFQVKPKVVEWLKPFKGAVYRYPGGTGSNHLDWRDTVGSQTLRPKRQRVDWLGPIAPQFGFDEYLDFVKQVNGSAWVVLNINGDYKKEGDHAVLSKDAADWVSYANRAAANGKPVVSYWELGNELDRYKWTAEKYTKIANQTIKAILAREPKTTFVGMLQDYHSHKEMTVSEYDRTIMTGLQAPVNNYAHHLYYEQERWGSVFERMSFVCKSVNDANAVKIQSPSFWITEHTRSLSGQENYQQWQNNWPKTSNLEAAIVVAESYIASTQFPEIKGLFLHSLGTAHGPWPLFNATKANDLHPSVVYWAMRILRDSMLPIVLLSKVESRNDEASIGDHDIRAAILTDAKSQQYVVWAVNRHKKASKLPLKIPALSGKNSLAKFSFIMDANKEANNYLLANNVLPQNFEKMIAFNAAGEAEVELPPYSVNAIQITPQ